MALGALNIGLFSLRIKSNWNLTFKWPYIVLNFL